ncbi:MAG TPA: LptF/LptG family permease [Gemmataceae bacterium]|nr:LptF/LptG family permease [Gemmataceae bacterium]
MKILDRYVIYAYIRSYFFCLISLLSLYIIIDLFNNLNDFFNHDKGLLHALELIATYYMYKSAQIFDRLCEPIVLLAGMFTVAWMQRNNELLPLLAAGVPTRRMLRPVLLGAVVLLSLGVANKECVIPRIADALIRNRDDLEGHRDLAVQPSYDSTGVHMEGGVGKRQGLEVTPFHCTIPDNQGYGFIHLSAEKANYIPPGRGNPSGGWMLSNTVPPELPDWNNPKLAQMMGQGRWFVPAKNVDFENITRNSTWYMYFSTARLHDLLNKSDSRRQEAMAVMFHMRLTRPIIGMLLVVMGLSVILRDPNRHVLISSGYCLVLTAVFFTAVYGCKFLGDNDLIAPALCAWLPVLIFGPVAFAMFDAIHT